MTAGLPDLTGLLDDLDAAREKATPGPWEHIVDDHGRKGIEHSIWSAEEGGVDGCYITELVEDPADAALIVAAVNALPGLVAAVRAVAELADEWEASSTLGLSALAGSARAVRAALAAALATHRSREVSGHCETCICGKRAPVQGEYRPRNPDLPPRPDGTVAWSEHLEAYADYAARYGSSQSAERLAERGGFGYYEIAQHLGREPKTWGPR